MHGNVSAPNPTDLIQYYRAQIFQSASSISSELPEASTASISSITSRSLSAAPSHSTTEPLSLSFVSTSSGREVPNSLSTPVSPGKDPSSLSSASTSSGWKPPSSSAAPTAHRKGPPDQHVAGIVIGSVLGTLLLCVTGLVFFNRHRKKSTKTKTSNLSDLASEDSGMVHNTSDQNWLRAWNLGRHEMPSNQRFEMEQPRRILELGLKPEEPIELAVN